MSVSQVNVCFGEQENPADPGALIQFFLPGGLLPTREIRFDLRREIGTVEPQTTDKSGRIRVKSRRLGAFGLSAEKYLVAVKGDKGSFGTTTAVLNVGAGQGYAPVFLAPLNNDPAVASANAVEAGVLDQKAPAEAAAAFEAGINAVRAGNREVAAISELTRAVSLYPPYPKALNQLGLVFFKSERFEEAVAAFTQAISVTRRYPAARLNLGSTFNRMGRPGDAARALADLVADYPDHSAARVILADALIRIQQWDEAGEQLRRALADSALDREAQAEGYYQLSQISYHEERYNSVVRESEKAIAAAPNWPNAYLAYLLQGGALYQLKKLEEAEKPLLKAYEIGRKRAVGAQLILGRIYTDRQKYEPALRAYEQYLWDFPTSPNAPMVLTAIERLKGMMKK